MLRKNKHKITVEEFLQFKPKRLDFKWETNEEGLVRIKVPKFHSKIGTSFCKLLKKDNVFNANLDKLGSIVWKNCDGRNTVKDLLEILKKEFHKEKDLDNRLYLFLQQMKKLEYIGY